MTNDSENGRRESEDIMITLQKQGLNERWAIKFEELETESERFAKGAGGELFRTKWRGLDCVAKTCKVEEKKQVLIDLANEIKVLSTLRHPRLVLFLGACFQVGRPPILLIEYCHGGNLESKLIKHTANATKMKISEALEHTLDLAVGLNFLHKCKPPVIHRDLKPSNILITRDNRIKITDFGLSKFVDLQINQTDRYKMTGETGSYRFMAPEVFKHEEYNNKVDVYSFALIVFWMVSGYKPFAEYRTDPIAAARSAAVVGKRPKIELVKHKGIHNLLQSCWSQDPDERPDFNYIVKEIEGYKQNMLKSKKSKAKGDRGSCSVQ